MDEADQGPASAGSAFEVNHPPAVVGEFWQDGVDVSGREGDMGEARAAPRDELGDGALVALGVALLFAELILRRQVRVVIHQQFEFAVADIDEDIAETAQNLRWAGMIDRAVLIRDETLGDVPNFHIGLRAVDGAAEIVGEDAHRGIIVVGGNAEVVDFVGGAVRRWNLHRLDEPRADTDGLFRIDGDEAFPVRSDALLGDGQPVLRCRAGGVFRRERHVMDARIARFLQVGIIRLEESDGRLADPEEGNVATFERYVAPRCMPSESRAAKIIHFILACVFSEHIGFDIAGGEGSA